MKTMSRIHNFSAGPAALPLEVLKQAQEELLCLPGAGASIMEISHRSKHFAAIHEEAKQGLKNALGMGDDWQVLFLQGGASTQFSMLPKNFMGNQGRAAYIRSGAWAKKAIAEAKKFGEVEVLWDGESEGFSTLPDGSQRIELKPGTCYFHCTSNETIEGIAWQRDPLVTGAPVFCDASSDILSRELDLTCYDLIYAGAQKNIGPSGVTVIFLKKSLLEKIQPTGPLGSMEELKLMAEKDSLYNTPPTFGIYMIGLIGKWLEKQGGVKAIEQQNRRKAAKIYEVIDRSEGFYQGHADTAFRSLMNVTFRCRDEALESLFVEESSKEGLSGLKGHRSVGGLRASIYNAVPEASIEALTSFMRDFAQRHG